MAYVKYRDVPYQRDVLLSADRLDYIEDGLVAAASDDGGAVTWDDVEDKPDDFPPEDHTHAVAQVTGLQDALDDKADSSALTSGLAGKANTSHTHTIANVTGLQDAIDGKADTTHTHAVAQVTGLQDALDDKADTTHTHAVAQVTGLQAILTDLEDRIEALEP